jgi:NAD+ kinase
MTAYTPTLPAKYLLWLWISLGIQGRQFLAKSKMPLSGSSFVRINMKIGIVGRKGRVDGDNIIPEPLSPIQTTILSIVKVLEDHQIVFDRDTVVTYPYIQSLKPSHQSIGDLARHVDLIIVIGGDGTLIDVARHVLGLRVPVIGVNMGRVGFITSVSADNAADTVMQMINNRKVTYETRHFIQLNAELNAQGWPSKGPAIALNDVVFKAKGGRMIEFKVSIAKKLGEMPQFVYKTRADGLIVATPTGSTAYALAARGSIIKPTARVIELIPMFPQTIAYAPLITDDSNRVYFELVSGEAEAYVDGMGPYLVETGKPLQVSIADPLTLELWHPQDYDYWSTLREKLNWHLEPGTK